MSPAGSDRIEGRLATITYRHPETHYTVARLTPLAAKRPVTVVGYLAGVQPGESLSVEGCWQTHPRFGSQFKVEAFSVRLPATVEGIESYLTSGMIKGIGPETARRLVAHFGPDTLRVIESEPARLPEVPGIGPAKAEAIRGAWAKHHTLRELMTAVQKAGLAPAHAARLLRLYGTDALTILQRTPYRAAEDLPDIGFSIADAFARDLGLPLDHPQRIRAGLLYLLERSVSEGHAFSERADLFERCSELTGVATTIIEFALAELAEGGDVAIEPASEGSERVAVYPAALHAAEVGVAQRLQARLSLKGDSGNSCPALLIQNVLAKLTLSPTPEQTAAMGAALSQPVLIITGGPGTGKTTLIHGIAEAFGAMRKSVLLAAPTGRAARRISEVTGRQAATIHRLLGYQANRSIVDRGPEDLLDADAMIVDEASMIDLPLMNALLMAVPPTAGLILVGDRNQLPPVGPGNVLADMIASRQFPTVELNHVFRQAKESAIVENAHRVLKGEFPVCQPPNDDEDEGDFYFFQQPEPKQAAQTIVELCSRHIPDRFGLDPLRDIQVLSPMHRGEVGVIALNQRLQDTLNPRRSATPSDAAGRFRVGDKVIQLKNNYAKDVFNGDIGLIDTVASDDGSLTVSYDGRPVHYETEELDELTLAYAVTVHKSQGSEYPAVVVPIMTQHYLLLYRNLLYTAITRGRRLVVVIGTSKAIDIALQNDRPQRRRGRLTERLTLKERAGR